MVILLKAYSLEPRFVDRQDHMCVFRPIKIGQFAFRMLVRGFDQDSLVEALGEIIVCVIPSRQYANHF